MLMPTISTDAQTVVDDLQTLCLYKGSVGTKCVTTPSDVSLGHYCTVRSSAVYFYYNREKKERNKGRQTGWFRSSSYRKKLTQKNPTVALNDGRPAESQDLNLTELVWDEGKSNLLVQRISCNFWNSVRTNFPNNLLFPSQREHDKCVWLLNTSKI